jgi:hypothetical protein
MPECDTSGATLPPFIDSAQLQTVVRQIVRSDSAEITDCSHSVLYGGLGAIEGRNSINRLAGHARVEDRLLPWSVVVKSISAPAPGAPAADLGHPDYWKREALTFASGLLDTLPDGFGAPRYFLVEESDRALNLWLEEVLDTSSPIWPLSCYGVAARHLGLFNGVYLDGRPLPQYAWLNRRLLRTRAERNAPFWSNLAAVRESALFRRGWPDDLGDRALGLFEERHALLDLLERLPQTIRHADAGRRNLFARDAGSTSETVAIDWAYTGIGPIGEDVAPLVVSSVLWFEGVGPADLRDLDALAFDAYVEGLHDAGWRGDPRLARIGCSATMALRFGPLLGIVGLVTADARQRPVFEQAFGDTLENVLDRYAEVQHFVFDKADEARLSLLVEPYINA